MRRKAGFIWCLLLWQPLISEKVTGQQLIFRDSLATSLTNQFDGCKPLILLRFTGKFDYSVMASAMKFSHWEKDPATDHILLLQKLKCRSEEHTSELQSPNTN